MGKWKRNWGFEYNLFVGSSGREFWTVNLISSPTTEVSRWRSPLVQMSGLPSSLSSYMESNLDPLLKSNSSESSSRVLSESKQIIELQPSLYATWFVVWYLFSFDSPFHLCLVSSLFLTVCSDTLISQVTAGFEQETGLKLSAEKNFVVHSIPNKQTLFTLFPSVSLSKLFMISLLSTLCVRSWHTALFTMIRVQTSLFSNSVYISPQGSFWCQAVLLILCQSNSFLFHVVTVTAVFFQLLFMFVMTERKTGLLSPLPALCLLTLWNRVIKFCNITIWFLFT